MGYSEWLFLVFDKISNLLVILPPSGEIEYLHPPLGLGMPVVND